MDGLLLDSEVVQRRAWQQAAAELGCSLSDEEFLLVIGRTRQATDRILVELWRNRGEPAEHLEEIRKRKTAYAQQEPLTLKAGVPELLTWIASVGIPAAVASSSTRTMVWQRLGAFGIATQVGAIVGGDEVADGKPAPDIFLLAAQRLQVAAPLCLVLEDSDSGVLAARAAGMNVILVPDSSVPRQIPADVAGLTYRRLGSLVEVRTLLR